MPTKFIVLVVALMTVVRPSRVLSQQAQSAPAPAKIELSPLHQGNRLGENVPVQLHLLDQNGHPVAAPNNIQAEVKVEEPSGRTETYSVTFAAGDSTKQVPLSIAESGVAKVTVQQREQQLIGGSNFVLVRPQAVKNPPPAAKKHRKPSEQTKDPNSGLQDFSDPRWDGARLVLAAFPPQNPVPIQGQPSPGAPELQLTVSGEDANGGTRADGSTCASVQVFYLGADDLRRDVQIWLSPSNGILDHNPIVIPKGTALGSACWTSRYPIPSATLAVAATNPTNFTFVSLGKGLDPRTVTHKFTDNISGIGFVNAPRSITIVDSFNLTAAFKDPNGQPVMLTDKREIHFSTPSSILKISPLQTTVDRGGFDSSTVIVPTYFGQSTVQVSSPYYPVVSQPITITWIGVLIASLLGGLFGGVLAWVNSQGKLWLRILTGLIVGLVASWAYVIVGLPKLETAFLHNQLSVFFVALLVGLSGVKGLTFISSKLNFPSF